MSSAQPNQSTWFSRRYALRTIVMVAVAGAILSLLVAIAYSRVPMRGAELFGAVANKIKGHPGATAFVSLGAGVALWLAVGLLAAGQEWSAARRRQP
jgi:hypothetical protein